MRNDGGMAILQSLKRVMSVQRNFSVVFFHLFVSMRINVNVGLLHNMLKVVVAFEFY